MDLFGKRLEIKTNKLSMIDCSIINVTKECDKYLIKFESSNIKFEPCNVNNGIKKQVK